MTDKSEMDCECMNEELWRVCPIYSSYEVSNKGRVRNKETKYILSLCKNIHSGYVVVNIKRKPRTLHRLVAITFIPNPQNKPCVDHINTVKTDNRVENLRWVTRSENCRNPITLKRNKESHTGLKQSEETKQKKREISKKNKIMCVETNEVFESIKDCGRKTKINYSHIGQVCKGKRKTAGGYHWKYAE